MPYNYTGYSVQQNAPNPGGSGNPGTVYNSSQRGAENYYGQAYGGQQAGLGRYRPPTMNEWNGSWNDTGGYAYNLPNNFGPMATGFGSGVPWAGPGMGPQQQRPMYGYQGQPQFGSMDYARQAFDNYKNQLGQRSGGKPYQGGDTGFNNQTGQLGAMFGGANISPSDWGGLQSAMNQRSGGVNPSSAPQFQAMTQWNAPTPQDRARMLAGGYRAQVPVFNNDPQFQSQYSQTVNPQFSGGPVSGPMAGMNGYQKPQQHVQQAPQFTGGLQWPRG